MKQKFISVGMPVFNGAKTIENAIRSILNQDHKNFELIISDNSSNDGTAEICKKYMKVDSRIIYIRQKRNVGMYKNFLCILEKAKGEYFIFNAADDQLSPSSLGRLYRCLDKNNQLGIAFPSSSFYKDDKYLYDGVKQSYLSKYQWVRQLSYALSVIDNSMYMGLHRTGLFKKIFKSYDPGQNEGTIYKLDWIQILVLLSDRRAKIVVDAHWKRDYSGNPDPASQNINLNKDIFQKNKLALSCYRCSYYQLNNKKPNEIIMNMIYLIFITRDYYSNLKCSIASIYKRNFK